MDWHYTSLQNFLNSIIKKRKMRKNEIVYSLTIEDIQTVAMEVLERELTKAEIKKIINPIGEKLNWFDAIEYSINEELL